MTEHHPVYVLGHSAGELERLERQAALFETVTRDVLIRAGVGAGQRVLDVGCGAGDVTLLLAELVGPSGRVVGVDRAAAAVDVARRRAATRKLAQVDIRLAALADLRLSPVDAVVGRFVLMHQADPVRTLADAAAYARPGGGVVMIESHLDALGSHWHASPASPAALSVIGLVRRTVRAGGARTDMGLRLRAAFLEAGLAEPELACHTGLAGAEIPGLVRYWIDSLRSMAPTAASLGVASLTQGDIDDMERAMLAELDVPGAVLLAPPVVSAWCAA